jgi:hypothetical protein
MNSFKHHFKEVLGVGLIVVLMLSGKIAYDNYKESQSKRIFIIVDKDLKLERRGEVNGSIIYQVWENNSKAGFISLPKK